MAARALVVFVVFSLCFACLTAPVQALSESTTAQGGRIILALVNKCWQAALPHAMKNERYYLLISCLKNQTLAGLDRYLASDTIKITDGFQLERIRNATLPERHVWRRSEYEDNISWLDVVVEKLLSVLKTHELKINLFGSTNVASPEGRRRHKNQMLIAMMFAKIALGMVLIPMGFQFLAVIGGKALLLAKMALILSSIQGLKKMATSPFNYGFYESHSWNPERHWKPEDVDHKTESSYQYIQPQ